MAKSKERKLKPISRKMSRLIEGIARTGIVEEIVLNITHKSRLQNELKDLAQIIYFALLQLDYALLEHLVSSGELRFYLSRMITNQYYSRNSPFYNESRKFLARSCEISTQMSNSMVDKSANII